VVTGCPKTMNETIGVPATDGLGAHAKSASSL